MLFSLLESFLILVPLLASIGFMTLAERRLMGSMQRRVGPNVVGVYGTLQPFADGLKLLLKEGVIPSQGNQVLFLVSPFVSLSLAIIGWAGIPFAKGTVLADVNLGVLFILAISSFGVYGVLLAGWSANSKYAFLGSLRSSAQLVSYELPLAMVILIVVSITGCLSFLQIVEFQQRVWLIIPLLPVSLVWFTVILAETNRAPFDLPEAEQELIAGFMVEHSAIPFALFYLAEYGSILLMSTLTSIFFFGGYTVPVFVSTNPFLQSLSLGLKNTIFFHLFVWVRATLPRVRFDKLMVLSWCCLLPLGFAFVVFTLCLLLTFGGSTT